MSRFPEVTFRLPSWIDEIAEAGSIHRTPEDQIGLAIELSRRNVEEGTGGPFGAAVFDMVTGALIAPGVNLVVASSTAVAHAEIMAIAVAGVATGSFDLGSVGQTVLAASTEPCAMCFGSVPWSGVRRLVCGARDTDAIAVGFDEGPKPADWVGALGERGIEVVRDVDRERATSILSAYATGGGRIYNGRVEI